MAGQAVSDTLFQEPSVHKLFKRKVSDYSSLCTSSSNYIDTFSYSNSGRIKRYLQSFTANSDGFSFVIKFSSVYTWAADGLNTESLKHRSEVLLAYIIT